MTRRATLTVALVASGLAAAALLLPALVQRGGAAEPFPAAAQLGIFAGGSAPRTVPPAVERAFGYLPGNAAQGQPQPGRLRRLGSGLGANRAALYTYPTDRGSVCLVMTEGGTPGTCVDRFEGRPSGAGLLLYSGADAAPTLAGVRGPGVAGVDVVVNGVPHSAIAGRHLVFFQLPPGSQRSDIDAVVIRMGDGSTARFFESN